MKKHKSKERKSEGGLTAYCLSIDMISSTRTLLQVTTAQFDKFNKELTAQITPHLKGLSLDHTDALLKFTGDGWLIMTAEVDKVLGLGYLAVVMSRTFQRSMILATRLSSIPALRLSICSGRDLLVSLPNKSRDFVGDSARRAVRATQFCQKNEILVDSAVKTALNREFEVSKLDITQRLRELKADRLKHEEELDLYVLGKMKSRNEVALEWEDKQYAYTLAVIGDAETAGKVLASSGMDSKGIKALLDGVPSYEGLRGMLPRTVFGKSEDAVMFFNSLISKAPSYREARRWWGAMRGKKIRPDVVTFNTLISKSDTLAKAQEWLVALHERHLKPTPITFNALLSKAAHPDQARVVIDQIRASGLNPNQVTSFTLLGKLTESEDYLNAKAWFDLIRESGTVPDLIMFNVLLARADSSTCNQVMEDLIKAGFKPDIYTYTTLIAKSADFSTAKKVLDDMTAAGLRHPYAFNSLFSKSLKGVKATDLLAWYLNQPFHSDGPVAAAIASYVRIGELEDACRLAWHYPYLSVSSKLMRTETKIVQALFDKWFVENPKDPNASYAVGVANFVWKNETEAIRLLRIALPLAAAKKRKLQIEQLLHLLEKRNP